MNDPGDSTFAVSVSESLAETEPHERLSVAILKEAGDWSAFAALERAIEAAADALADHPKCGIANGVQASVVLGDDALVRRLNKTYRHRDKPTNVLSFPFQVPSGATCRGVLGDVVLAAETVAREAAERGIAPTHHLQHLAVHGLLHLLGFDHETDTQAEDMERIETEILAALGVADPHAPAGIA